MERSLKMTLVHGCNILSIIQEDGFSSKKVASTRGGEYAGPCPWCGGKDRFLIWPQYRGGRYWCRGCARSGDAIQYIRDTRNLSFLGAIDFLGIEKPRFKKRQWKQSGPPPFNPKNDPLPPLLWIEKASRFLQWAQNQLWASGGRAALDLLTGKGLNEETIREAGIGWNPGEYGKDTYRDRRGWGLPCEVRRDGRPKRLWLPMGLVIPLQSEEGPRRIRLRRPEPDEGPRYVIIAGSVLAPLILAPEKKCLLVVESELDAWLCWQEAGDLVGVVALGSAAMKPDASAHELLLKSEIILNALDYDEAGARYAWKFWPETYGQKVKRWPVSIGKDPSDAWQQGLSIRAWIEAGMTE